MQQIKTVGGNVGKLGIIVALLVAVFGAVHLSKTYAAGETVSTATSVQTTVNVSSPVTGIHINGTAGATVPVKLEVTTGSLSMSTTTGLTFGGGIQTGSVIYFSATVANANAALATLEYDGPSIGAQTLTVSLVAYGEIFYPANGHLYEYVTFDNTQHYTWQMAFDEAATKTKYGAQGYLATVTTAGENDFVNDRLLGAGWMAASDAAQEGDWKWMAGPEAGQSFWAGAISGTPVSGRYSAWETNQPDNTFGTLGFMEYENCAQFGLGATLTGKWNDLPCSLPLPGYVVEYGAPGDMPVIQKAVTQLLVTAAGAPADDGDGVASSTENAGPNGGDANHDGTLDSLQANVASFISPISHKPVVLQTDASCPLTHAIIAAPTHADGSYTYPAGLLDFTATCGVPGFTSSITHYYYDFTSDARPRKFDPQTNTYIDINEATTSVQRSAGQTFTELTYQATDGGALDSDGTLDGVIVDPAGLAVNPATASGSVANSPNTGFGQPVTASHRLNKVLLISAGALIVSGLIVLHRQKRLY